MAGFVGVVEEEGAAVGEADIAVCEVFAVGGEGEDFVVVLRRGGGFWHGYFCRRHSWPAGRLTSCEEVVVFFSSLRRSTNRLSSASASISQF